MFLMGERERAPAEPVALKHDHAMPKAPPPLEPMTLGGMRALGVTRLALWFAACRRGATAEVESLPDERTLPEMAGRYWCSVSSARLAVQPDWTPLRASKG